MNMKIIMDSVLHYIFSKLVKRWCYNLASSYIFILKNVKDEQKVMTKTKMYKIVLPKSITKILQQY